MSMLLAKKKTAHKILSGFFLVIFFMWVHVSSAGNSWQFSEITAITGLDYHHAYNQPDPGDERYFSGGATVGDFDADGWLDLLLITGDLLPNVLLRNNQGVFEDVTAYSGLDIHHVGTGALFADIDADGILDVIMGNAQHGFPRLFQGLGGGVFQEQFNATIFPVVPVTTSPTFADYDGDGDLDLFLAQWNSVNASLLWRNDGNFVFTPVSDIAFQGYQNSLRYTFTPNFTDINADGWLDLLVASDFGRSQVLINDQDGTFTLATDESVITDEHGMGATVGDYDNDGDMDWFVTSIHYDGPLNPGTGITGNRLYQNNGLGEFSDVTEMAGVRSGDWGWGACFADFDNDGFQDIFHVNGWRKANDVWFDNTPARLFMNMGDGTFAEEAALRNIADSSEGRGVICFDYDNDGDVDVLTANNSGMYRLYENQISNTNHLQIELRNVGSDNYFGIGSKVQAIIGKTTHTREIRAGSNYLSNNPSIAHFGLGASTRVESVRVIWPNQTESKLLGVQANNRIVVEADLITAGGFE